jgi:GH24 family phage-related lysozyme (muramidase)
MAWDDDPYDYYPSSIDPRIAANPYMNEAAGLRIQQEYLEQQRRMAQAQQSGPSASGGLSPSLVDAIKGFEGYTANPKWDYQQYSSGWGTKARPGEVADRATHEQRLQDELTQAATFVDSKVPDLPSGVRDAMISLTFNAGGKWADSSLGAKLREGPRAPSNCSRNTTRPAGDLTGPY